MPGFLLHQGATVMCSHGGQAQPTTPNPRVTVMGMPTLLLPTPFVVAACAFPPPPVANGPCISATYMAGTVRVLSNAMPLLLFNSPAICAPTGTPLLPAITQTRVVAS